MNTEKIKTIIIDDEPLAREKIRHSLQEETDIEIISECNNGKSAISEIKNKNPDLVFLDIQMPECDGFEVIRRVGPGNMPTVIFVTAYDQYALKAFETHALDYLLKPFDIKRFKSSLKRAKTQILNNRTHEFGKKLLSLVGEGSAVEKKYMERVVIKSVGNFVFLNVDEIDWIEASGNYIYLHTKANRHLLRETMNGIEVKLDPEIFIRVHRSYIIKIDRIKEFQSMFNGTFSIKLKDGTAVISSRGYLAKLNALLNS